MPCDILSVKLKELDKKICKLHSGISASGTAGKDDIKAEIAALKDECERERENIGRTLELSRSSTVAELFEAYKKVEEIISEEKEKAFCPAGADGEVICLEKKILFAEYSLDFALQAANRALLTSMEAIYSQLIQQEREENSL